MKTNITFRHMKASQALKDFVQKRLEQLDHFAKSAKNSHVILTAEKEQRVAEVILAMGRFRAQAKATTLDMYSAVDQAVDKVEAAIRRHHDKKVQMKVRPARDAEVA